MSDFVDDVFDGAASALDGFDDCRYVVPDENGHVPWGACHGYYMYYPSLAGNAAFAILFALATLIHFQQMCHYRKFYCIVAVAAGIMEFVAFVVRAAGARMQQQGDLVSGSNFVFLLAPLFLNAFVYMTYSRAVRNVVPREDEWRARHRWISHCYVWLMLTAAVLQTAAVGVMFSGHDRTFAAAQKVYAAGLGVQAVFDVELAVVICQAARKFEALDALGRPTRQARMLLWAALAALGLLVLRIVYRVVDFILGKQTTNPLATSELPTFMLDALPMFLILLLFALCHPGRVLFATDEEKRRKLQQRASDVGAAPVHAHFVNQAPPQYEPRAPPEDVPTSVLPDEPRRPGDDMVKQKPFLEATAWRHDEVPPVSPFEEDTTGEKKTRKK